MKARPAERGAPVGPRAALTTLRDAQFAKYFVGNIVGAIGVWIQNVTTGFLVYRLTGSTVYLGVLAFAQFFGVAALAPWSGSAADRFDRRRLLIITQSSALVLSAALAVLTATNAATAIVVIAISFGIGLGNAFAIPAQMALVAQLVSPGQLSSATGLNALTYNVARAVGPVLAAVCVAAFGISVSLGISTAAILFLLVALLSLTVRAQTPVARGESSLFSSISLVRRDPRLLIPLFVVAAAGWAADPINTLAPAWAAEFGKPAVHGGYLIGAFGLGAVLAAAWLAGRFVGADRRLALTLGTLGGATMLFSAVPWLPLAYALLVIAGFCYLATSADATSRLQLGIADEHRGRVMALWSVAFVGLRPVAGLLDGLIATSAGIRWAGIVLALPALTVTVALWLRTRSADQASPGSSRPPLRDT